MLRWASEKAVNRDDAMSRLGIAALEALSESDLLQTRDIQLVFLVTQAVTAKAVSTYSQLQDAPIVSVRQGVEIEEGEL